MARPLKNKLFLRLSNTEHCFFRKEKSKANSDIDTWLAKGPSAATNDTKATEDTKAATTDDVTAAKPAIKSCQTTNSQWLLPAENVKKEGLVVSRQLPENPMNKLIFHWNTIAPTAQQDKPKELPEMKISEQAAKVVPEPEALKNKLLSQWNSAQQDSPKEVKEELLNKWRSEKKQPEIMNRLLNLWTITTSPEAKVELDDWMEVKEDATDILLKANNMEKEMNRLDMMMDEDQDWIFSRTQEIDPVLAVQQGFQAFHAAVEASVLPANQSTASVLSANQVLSPVSAVKEGFKTLMTGHPDMFKPDRSAACFL